MSATGEPNPHGDTSAAFGVHPKQARVVVVLIHGRGSDGKAMIAMAHDITDADDVAWLAPTAANNAWYPAGFMAPWEDNQPWFDHTIDRFCTLLDRLSADGVDDSRIVLMGFSQGACVSAEMAVRRPRGYGGVVVFSGGLAGPPDTIWALPAGLDDVPVLVSISDDDPYIPVRRAHDTAGVFHSAGAAVDYRLYERVGHTVGDDARAGARSILDGID